MVYVNISNTKKYKNKIFLKNIFGFSVWFWIRILHPYAAGTWESRN